VLGSKRSSHLSGKGCDSVVVTVEVAGEVEVEMEVEVEGRDEEEERIGEACGTVVSPSGRSHLDSRVTIFT